VRRLGLADVLAHAGRVQGAVDITDLKRVGDQIDRAANRLSVSLVVAALTIGSSIVMTVGGGLTLLGLPKPVDGER
jgi:ubiquinone biosynthesis protein